MELIKGVKVVLADGINPVDRIQLNTGTYLAPSSIGIKYFDGAVLPISQWRNATSEELHMLLGVPESWERGNSIAVLPIRQSLLHKFEPLNLDQVNSPQELSSIYKDNYYKIIIQEVLTELTKTYSLHKSDRNRVLGVTFAEPNLLTIASTLFDQNQPSGERRLIGLHFDYAGELDIHESHLARNRLAINLGRSDRYLLYVNQSVNIILNWLSSNRRVSQEEAEIWQLAGKFFDIHPSYPIVRIKIKPGEAYIAPTENVIHDGSSEGTSFPDISAHFLGDFDFFDYNSLIKN